MAVDALWRENQTDHNAVQYRQMMAGLAGWKIRTLGGSATSGTANGGVLGPVPSATTGPLAVTERGAGANMSVDVAVGGAMVGGTAGSGAAHRGDYFAYADATENVAITASDPTNPRIDLVGIRIRDTAYAEADDTPVITVVTGTAAGSPSVPAVPDNFLTLAQIAVAAAASSITNANITDQRVAWAALGGIAQRASSASYPTVNLWEGMFIYDLALHALLQYTTATTLWRAPWNLPWGNLAHVTGNANVSGNGASFVQIIQATGIVVPANRKIRVTYNPRPQLNGGVGTYSAQLRRDVGGSVVDTWLYAAPVATTVITRSSYAFQESPAAGTISYEVGFPAAVSTVQFDIASATDLRVLRVDDVGPNAAPA